MGPPGVRDNHSAHERKEGRSTQLPLYGVPRSGHRSKRQGSYRFGRRRNRDDRALQWRENVDSSEERR